MIQSYWSNFPFEAFALVSYLEKKKNTTAQTSVKKLCSCFLLVGLWFPGLTFRSLKRFELDFVCGVRLRVILFFYT